MIADSRRVKGWEHSDRIAHQLNGWNMSPACTLSTLSLTRGSARARVIRFVVTHQDGSVREARFKLNLG
jgi:hypothetical protein